MFDEECCECIVKPCEFAKDCSVLGSDWYWNEYTCNCKCALKLTGEKFPDGRLPNYDTCKCEGISGCDINE